MGDYGSILSEKATWNSIGSLLRLFHNSNNSRIVDGPNRASQQWGVHTRASCNPTGASCCPSTASDSLQEVRKRGTSCQVVTRANVRFPQTLSASSKAIVSPMRKGTGITKTYFRIDILLELAPVCAKLRPCCGGSRPLCGLIVWPPSPCFTHCTYELPQLLSIPTRRAVPYKLPFLPRSIRAWGWEVAKKKRAKRRPRRCVYII